MSCINEDMLSEDFIADPASASTLGSLPNGESLAQVFSSDFSTSKGFNTGKYKKSQMAWLDEDLPMITCSISQSECNGFVENISCQYPEEIESCFATSYEEEAVNLLMSIETESSSDILNKTAPSSLPGPNLLEQELAVLEKDFLNSIQEISQRNEVLSKNVHHDVKSPGFQEDSRKRARQTPSLQGDEGAYDSTVSTSLVSVVTDEQDTTTTTRPEKNQNKKRKQGKCNYVKITAIDQANKRISPRIVSPKEDVVSSRVVTPKNSGAAFKGFNLNYGTLSDEIFETYFKKLEEFKVKFGHCDVPSKYDTDPSLGNWCSQIKTSLRNNHKGIKGRYNVSRQRTRRLEKIGFKWKEVANVVNFDKRCNELMDFKKMYGHCNVPKRYAENPALGRWCGNMRTAYNKLTRGQTTTYNLSKDRIERLNNIGFKWKAN